MEPASIFSTALNATKVLAQVGTIVYELNQNHKAVPAEIAALGRELKALEEILNQLKEGEGAAGVDAGGCDDALHAVSAKLARVERKVEKGGFDRFVVTLMATETRAEIRNLLSDLERSKTSLLLSMQVMNMRGWQAALDAASNARSGAATISELNIGAVDAQSVSLGRAHCGDGILSERSSVVVEAGESVVEVHPSVVGWLSSFQTRS